MNFLNWWFCDQILKCQFTLLEAGIILPKLPETLASPDQNSSSLNPKDKAKKGAEQTTNNEPFKIVFKMTQIKRQGKVHS